MNIDAKITLAAKNTATIQMLLKMAKCEDKGERLQMAFVIATKIIESFKLIEDNEK